ncbi:MAG: DUF3667 domain-containing protein [Flavobacterium sp.]|nr:DUF3667 domain-containing protein [Flavobacterium sp.]
MQPQLCKNCEHVFQGNFCSNCGQKTNTVRLDWHYIQDELKYTFLHINKGFLYTAKQLFIRPGDTVREFIEGKRVQHYKPILLLFVLAGLNGLLMHFLPVEDFIYKPTPDTDVARQQKIGKEIYDFLTKNYALYELFVLPIYAFCSWLAFKKFGYNYIENIIINCFATSQRLIIGILLFPIQYFLRESPYLVLFSFLTIIPPIGYTIWLVVQLYKKQDLGSVILRMLLFAFNITVFILLLFFIGIIIFAYLIKAGYIDKQLFIG